MLSVIIFLLTVFFSGSHQQCFSNNDTTKTHIGESYYNWIDSRNDFGVSMFKLLNKDDNNENLIFSPSSVHDILLVAYFGAAGYTEASLGKVLRKPHNIEKSHAWRFYQTERAIHSDKGKKSYPLKSANKIFFSNKLQLRPCIQENLRTETEVIDYRTNVKWAENYINSWVENMTGGEIKGPVKGLLSEAPATMVNAVFFKGNWSKPFNPKESKPIWFQVDGKRELPCRLMYKDDYFAVDYLDTIKARVLKLPYEGENQAMIILLPNSDLDSTIASLNSNVIKLITSTDMLKVTRKIKVGVPLFQTRKEIKLTSTLRKLGIGNTLTGYADFSRFTGKKEVFFFDVNQQAVIKVDEEGTTAAGSTQVEILLSGILGPTESFICDRPFAYFIYDYVTHKIIFMGTFRKPEKIRFIPLDQ